MRPIIAVLFCLFITNVSAQKNHLPPFKADDQPAPPDYTKQECWSALPFRADVADIVPPGEQPVNDSLKQADVFYIYPTIYQHGATWNADINNKKLNQKIDHLPVLFQAGVFNATCRIYAPRYRQGIIDCFYDSINGSKGLDFAYQDVKNAFQYYLTHYNNGHPFIIASHSQGSSHAWRLLREFIDGKPLSKQLVCAYVVGMGVDEHSYQVIKPCGQPAQTGCYITWSSFKQGFDPHKSVLRGAPNVNPITWTRDTFFVPATSSQGSIFLKIKHKKWQHATSAQVHQDYLWAKTRLPFVRSWKVLHLLDYNLFWYDIRKNVADRVNAFLKSKD